MNDQKSAYRSEYFNENQQAKLIDYIEECKGKGVVPTFNSSGFTQRLHAKSGEACYKQYLNLVNRGIIERPINHEQICELAEQQVMNRGMKKPKVDFKLTPADAIENLLYIQRQDTDQRIHELCSQLNTTYKLDAGNSSLEVINSLNEMYQRLIWDYQTAVTQDNSAIVRQKNEIIATLTTTIEEIQKKQDVDSEQKIAELETKLSLQTVDCDMAQTANKELSEAVEVLKKKNDELQTKLAQKEDLSHILDGLRKELQEEKNKLPAESHTMKELRQEVKDTKSALLCRLSEIDALKQSVANLQDELDQQQEINDQLQTKLSKLKRADPSAIARRKKHIYNQPGKDEEISQLRVDNVHLKAVCKRLREELKVSTQFNEEYSKRIEKANEVIKRIQEPVNRKRKLVKLNYQHQVPTVFPKQTPCFLAWKTIV